MVKGWSRRASGRISPFSFSSLWGQHTPQPWRRGPKKPSSVCRSLPGIHFIVSVTLSPDKGKQLRQETGCFQMRKPKKRWKRNMVRFSDEFCQQRLSHPAPSSESFHCILTTNPTLCLEKQRGDSTEIYIGIFGGCMGMPRAFGALFRFECCYIQIRVKKEGYCSSSAHVWLLVVSFLLWHGSEPRREIAECCNASLFLRSAATL